MATHSEDTQKQVGVYPHISFFWDSRLPDVRKQEISDWLSTLTPAQRDMVQDIRDDSRESGEYNVAGY